MTVLCIYLHGFNSSSQSEKAQILARYFSDFDVRFEAPTLPGSVSGTLNKVEEILRCSPRDELVFIGSSLGGLFAAYFAEKYKAKAVLINPAFEEMFEQKTEYLGRHVNPYTGEVFEIDEQHYQALEKLLVENALRPEHYLLLLQTGDDVLDYRRALARFPQSPHIVQVGGSHRFDNFADVLEDIGRFMGII